MPKRQVVVIVHDVRSCHNVGSIFRTAEGLGATKIYLTGYTPYPGKANDIRLPHLARKIDAQIEKTALGAQQHLGWDSNPDIGQVIADLKKQGYLVAAVEQSSKSTTLTSFKPPAKLALIVGNEKTGLEKSVVKQVDTVLEIPMSGKKESFNVAIAVGIALYHCQNS